MIEEILPGQVAAVEARDDSAEELLFGEEQALLEGAIDKRRREFATGRMCARSALRQLGHPASAILPGSRGEPLWPEGVVGSITHCDGYRAAAVARSSEILTVGIDAEPHAQLPDGVLEQIARAEELAVLRRLCSEEPRLHWDRLLFSAKESVYKACYPLSRRWLGFEQVSIAFDPSRCTFLARLLTTGPTLADGPLRALSGRWLVQEGIGLTAIAMSVE
ncbi:MAG TPA: 4'-phosphopantetheinyl transferase superfamily protein [Solirubrobacteraceae bacterium]|jgi:4'-phosphopantetheinyl transferase EntD|nr:4'-phosphopantetheinyl transferase superfamily protein [Solirubrobacteraceae bacterium]